MPESESGALPLGDTPIVVLLALISRASLKLAGVRGFEPRNAGIRIRCLTAWRYPNKLFSNRSNTSTRSEYGGYDGIRTCDPIIMSDVLSPTELRSQMISSMAGVPGFEPGNAGIIIRCLTAWRDPNKLLSNRSNTSTRSEDGGYDGIRTCDPIIMSDVL